MTYTPVTSIVNNRFTYTLPAHSALHFVFTDLGVAGGVKAEIESPSKVAISFDSTPNVIYKIQTSTDLLTWSDLGTTTYAGNGVVIKVELGMPTASTFWRVVPVK